MEITVNRPTRFEVDAIMLVVPVEADQTGLPRGYGGLSPTLGQLAMVLDLNECRVLLWPRGDRASLHIRVGATGRFSLGAYRSSLGPQPLTDAERIKKFQALVELEWYVPACLPQQDGEDLVMEIESDGHIRGWAPDADEVLQSFSVDAARWLL